MVKSLILCFCFHIFSFQILDYDLIKFQNGGPYLFAFKGMNFTYNANKTVPDAIYSGEDDCSVVSKNTYTGEYTCYGKVSTTSFSNLADDSLDGAYIISKGTGTRVSYVSLVCDETTYAGSGTFNSDVNFTVTYYGPFACKGSGPGYTPPLKSPIKGGAFGYTVLGVVVGILVISIVTFAVYALLKSNTSHEPMLAIFISCLCYIPILIKDGVLYLFSIFTGKRQGIYEKI